MIESREEVTLANQRLHRGVFIPPVLLSIVLAVASLPELFFLKFVTNMMGGLNPQAPSPFWRMLLPILVLGAALFCLLLLVTWLAYAKSEITLTNRRLVFKMGLLSRLSGELPLENVEAIIIMEPLLGRLFGYGTIVVSGIGGSTFPFKFIASPEAFHAKLQKAVADAKRPVANVGAQRRPPPPDDSRYMPK